MPVAWFWISIVAFVAAIALLLVSGFCFVGLLTQVIPLLDETRNQVQDLGDLAANTVGRANESLEIVESRVSQAMEQAAVSGKDAAKQALGVGTVLAGGYLVVRLIGMVRDTFFGKRKPHNKPKHDKPKPKPSRQRKWVIF